MPLLEFPRPQRPWPRSIEEARGLPRSPAVVGADATGQTVHFRDKFRRAVLWVAFRADSVPCALASRVIPKVDEHSQVPRGTSIAHILPSAILLSLKLKLVGIGVFAAIECNSTATIRYKRALLPTVRPKNNQAVL